MGRRRDISNTVRGQIYTLFKKKKSYSYISKQLSMSKATVIRVIKSVAATNSIEKLSRKHKRAPAKLEGKFTKLRPFLQRKYKKH